MGTGHLVGFIVVGLQVLTIIVYAIFRHITWNKRKPKDEYRGIRYIYKPGAVKWEKLHDAIDIFAEHIPEATNFWLVIVPYEDAIISNENPTGYTKGGYPVGYPNSPERAAEVRIINGITDFEKKYPIFTSKTPIVYVRQMKEASVVDVRLRINGGKEKGMHYTALVHEIVEHVYPWRKGETSNRYHERKDLTELSNKINKLLASLSS